MGSVFGEAVKGLDSQEFGEELRIQSEKFRFYKVRLYGVWHLVKTPVDAFASDLMVIESLRKEFAIGYTLNHPGIVRYHRMENGALYEEFIDGITLREAIDAGDPRFESPEILRAVCSQLLEAVDYMHSMGVVHCDLKPENVMLTRIGNRVKIIDFGCAVNTGGEDFFGYTPEYQAPEQREGDANHYTDLYHVGRIMGELATATGKVREWRKFVKKATAELPERRFASAASALKALPGSRHEGKNFLIILSIIVAFALALSIPVLLTMRRTSDLQISLQDPKASLKELNLSRSQDTIPQEISTVPLSQSAATPSQLSSAHGPKIDEPLLELPKSSGSESENPRVNLEEEIQAHVSLIFERNFKYVRKRLNGELKDSTSQVRYEAFNKANDKSFDDVRAYISDLSKRNPDRKSMIEDKALNLYETRSAAYYYEFFDK